MAAKKEKEKRERVYLIYRSKWSRPIAYSSSSSLGFKARKKGKKQSDL
jgi:hypothetical protein